MYSFLKNIFIDYDITVVPFRPPHSTPSCPPPLPHSPPYSSCPWVILINSLASTFPTLFLPSPYFPPILYATYSLYLSPLSPSHSPIDTPPCDLHLYGSVTVLVVCQFALVFVLGVVVNNCEFAVIFTVPIFDLLFLR